MFTKNADLILEVADLLSYNNRTKDIVVDKSIFDDFKMGKQIYIHFVEDEPNCVRVYTMISEDDDGITMEYWCEYVD